MSAALYADVVVQIEVAGLPQPLTYSIPPTLTVGVGEAVVVPFGSQQAVGYVIGLSDTCPPGHGRENQADCRENRKCPPL